MKIQNRYVEETEKICDIKVVKDCKYLGFFIDGSLTLDK